MSIFNQTQQDIEQSINILPGSKFWREWVSENMSPLYQSYRRSDTPCFSIENNKLRCLIREGTMTFVKKTHAGVLQYIPNITRIECPECIAFDRCRVVDGDCGIRDLDSNSMQFMNVIYVRNMNLHGHIYFENTKRIENVNFDCQEIVTSIRFPKFRNCNIQDGTTVSIRCYDLKRNTQKVRLFFKRLSLDLWNNYISDPALRDSATTSVNKIYIPYQNAGMLNVNKMFGLNPNIGLLNLDFPVQMTKNTHWIMVNMRFVPVKEADRHLFDKELTQDGFLVNYCCTRCY